MNEKKKEKADGKIKKEEGGMEEKGTEWRDKKT